MANSDITEVQTLILGDLAPLFDEYVGIINSVPKDAPDIKIPHNSDIAEDTWAKSRDKLTTANTIVQIHEAKEKSAYKTTSAQENALRKERFVGSIPTLFKSIIDIQEVPMSEAEIIELSQIAQAYLQIPEDRRRSAKLSDGDGYYWGGRLIRFAVTKEEKI